jgi:hypothetical protein
VISEKLQRYWTTENHTSIALFTSATSFLYISETSSIPDVECPNIRANFLYNAYAFVTQEPGHKCGKVGISAANTGVGDLEKYFIQFQAVFMSSGNAD